MIPYLDPVDVKWRIRGYEHLRFTTEQDAHEAAEMAIEYAIDQLTTEYRYRRAAERAKEKAA